MFRSAIGGALTPAALDVVEAIGAYKTLIGVVLLVAAAWLVIRATRTL